MARRVALEFLESNRSGNFPFPLQFLFRRFAGFRLGFLDFFGKLDLLLAVFFEVLWRDSAAHRSILTAQG